MHFTESLTQKVSQKLKWQEDGEKRVRDKSRESVSKFVFDNMGNGN